MYDETFVGMKGIQSILGISREKATKLCNTKPFGFPAVKVGNRYRAEESKLVAWKDDWYSGKFDLTI